ncbi:uncharacterized protein LOC118465486 [Anopheles albimanus]|uniref:Uncharacterized protein n=1 Tax=Anopheles albimanus TaxID=7167 RepID=A0A182FGI3_ANOAL|nr:uncharacterized protein LOC118465486 [Anopheles albimanus]
MKSSAVTLCSTVLVLLAVLRSGGCLDEKLALADRLSDSLDILQEDSQVESLAPVSHNTELFAIAKRLTQKRDPPAQRRDLLSDGTLFSRQNNLDLLEDNSAEFLDLTVDIAYSAIYLLRNYTRFVRNADNKFIVIFE